MRDGTEHDELTSEERAGYAVANTRAGRQYLFRTLDYPALREAWTRGQAFFLGVGPAGEVVEVKLAEVECLVLWSAETIRRRRALNAEEHARDRAERLVRGED